MLHSLDKKDWECADRVRRMNRKYLCIEHQQVRILQYLTVRFTGSQSLDTLLSLKAGLTVYLYVTDL